MFNQLLLGAAIPFAIGMTIYVFRRARAGLLFLICMPAAMAAGAVWAVVPDIPRLIGMQALYNRLANDPRCDIFFWHYTIDRIEQHSSWYTIGWGAMAAFMILIALRELKLREVALHE